MPVRAGRWGGWSAAGAALSLAALVTSPLVWPKVTWVFCLPAGVLSLVWLSRSVSRDPWLARIAVSSYVVRTGLTLALFAISYWHLPIAEELQRGQGFWQIGGDGLGYHRQALRILEAWRDGIELPFVFGNGMVGSSLYRDMALPLAFLYRVLGTSLLHGLLFNAWLGSLTALPAYVLARRMADHRGARVGAALVAFWPSSMLWSSQLLKDSAASLVLLTTLCGLIILWQGVPGSLSRSRRRAVLAVSWAGLVVGAAIFTYFRFYMGYLLLGSVAVVMGITSLGQLWRRRYHRAGLAMLLIAVVGVGVAGVRSTDLLRIFSSRDPVPAYIAQGAAHRQAGELDRAAVHYMRALELDPGNDTALDALRAVVREASDRLTTVDPPTMLVFAVAAQVLSESRRLSQRQLAELNLQLGILQERAGALDEEIYAYIRVVDADPTAGDAVARLLAVTKAELAWRRTGPGALHNRTLAGALLLLKDSRQLPATQITALCIQMGEDFQGSGDTAHATDAYLWALEATPRDRPAATRLLGMVHEELARREQRSAVLKDAVPTEALRTLSASRRIRGADLAALYRRLAALASRADDRNAETCAYLWAVEADPNDRLAAEALIQAVKDELSRRSQGEGRLRDAVLAEARHGLRETRRHLQATGGVHTMVVQRESVFARPALQPPPRVSGPALMVSAGSLPAPSSDPETRTWVERLKYYRLGMINTGGHSLIDAHVTFSSTWEMVAYLPRAWAIAFLAPFPTQWFDTGGETGVFRLLSGIEMLLLYPLLIPMLQAGWILIRRHGTAGWMLVCFSALSATLLSLTVTNVGTLFRLRLQYLLPLLIAVGIAATPQFSQAPRHLWIRLRRRLRPSRIGREAAAGRISTLSLAVGVLAGLVVLAQWPVTTRYGVEYQWSSRTITLLEKAAHFFSRDLQARRLMIELTKGARSRDERLKRLFDWTVHTIRPVPAGLPIVDDHPFHIIIRGYGTPDQQAEAFALLASYAGFPSGAAFVKAPGTTAYIVMTVVRDGTRQLLFDVHHNVAFTRPGGGFADVREVRANDRLIPASARSLTVYGIPYERYLDGLAAVEPRFDRMEAQRPWLRLRQRLAAVFRGSN